MRNTPNLRAEKCRLRTGPRGTGDDFGNNGIFLVPVRGVTLTALASDGGGWDHVSVSLPHRTPTWEEMAAVKELFFRDDEAVVQYHPAKSEYVNHHPFCLHLWRPQAADVPTPPAWMVGPKAGQSVAEGSAEGDRALGLA